MTKPSELLRHELKKMLGTPGALNAFCDANDFKFNSVYKIATKSIEQPGLDYGFNLLAALKKDHEVGRCNCLVHPEVASSNLEKEV